MTISSVALGQALASGLFLTGESSITSDLVHFAAAEAKAQRQQLAVVRVGDLGMDGVVDCRRFARVVAGLDGEATRRFEAAKKERRERVAQDAGEEATH